MLAYRDINMVYVFLKKRMIYDMDIAYTSGTAILYSKLLAGFFKLIFLFYIYLHIDYLENKHRNLKAWSVFSMLFTALHGDV